MAYSKLTSAQIIQLVIDYNGGVSATKLARSLGVTTTTITTSLTRAGVVLRDRKTTQQMFRQEFKQSERHSAFIEKMKQVNTGRVFSIQSRNRMSKARSEGIASGKIESRCYGKSGWYKGFFCRSTYEKEFIDWCQARNLKVEPCRLVIPYQYEGLTKNYIPDFIDVENREIIEIKPMKLRDTAVNQAKFAAADQYCSDNNYKFRVVTEWTLFNKRGFREDYRC